MSLQACKHYTATLLNGPVTCTIKADHQHGPAMMTNIPISVDANQHSAHNTLPYAHALLNIRWRNLVSKAHHKLHHRMRLSTDCWSRRGGNCMVAGRTTQTAGFICLQHINKAVCMQHLRSPAESQQTLQQKVVTARHMEGS